MISIIYQLLWRIAPPFIRYYLRKRAQKNPAYLEHWNERFGQAQPNPVQNPIWIHAVSVGETHAAAPLIAQLRQHFPNHPFLITQMTPTGRATAQQLFPDISCRYLPYDHPKYIDQFLREHRPQFGIIMETELWANLLHACQAQNIPLFLANARLSEKSWRAYQKVHSLIAPAMQAFTACLTQTEQDAQRLRQLGAPEVSVCGNTKYDIVISEKNQKLAVEFKQKIGNRAVIVCGSTRFYHGEDEAQMLLNAWQKHTSNALLVIVPRHPERFEIVFQTALNLGFKVQKRSDNQAIASDTQVWIGDSMGELPAYYQIADIAFVGGSLVDSGCQNIIEPIACGVPTIFGYSTYNFAAACENALQAGAAKQVASAQEWFELCETWLNNIEIRAKYSENAHFFIAQHQGASTRMVEKILRYIQ